MKRPILLLVLAMAVGLMGAHTSTAQADNDWLGHEKGAQQWHRHHIHHGRYVPGPYVQENPYVVYAPPVVVEPPSGINIILPLNIR